MNQNETKLDLVNPMSPNQIIRSEIITENQNINENNNETLENNTNQDISQTLENNIVQDVNNNKNEQKPKKKFNLLLIIIVLIVVVAIGGGVLFFMQKDKNNKPNKPTITENRNEVSTYEFSINTDTYTNNVTDKFELKVQKNNENLYDIYINNNFILSDIINSKIKFYIVDNNLIYLNHSNDKRTQSLYIIDKDNNMNTIYELDTINGMVPDTIEIKKDSIVIVGTRLLNNEAIIYNSIEGNILLNDFTTWEQYGVNEDTIIKATYTYKFENDKLNLQPTITNEISLKNYLAISEKNIGN